MAGKSQSGRLALALQNNAMLGLLTGAGYEHVEPDILQPADLFLDRSGEDIRTRTFVFTDPSGRELCLRPDLTIPTCRYHLACARDPSHEARYCYLGPAFRHQPQGGDRMHPSEFVQVGLEWFGDLDHEAAEAEILDLTIRAVETAGLRHYRVKLGDLALFTALLASIDIPQRWRERLLHQFWRPKAFHELVERLTARRERNGALSNTFRAVMASGDDTGKIAAIVEETLEREGIPLVGGRPIEEIAGRLHEKVRDLNEPPLPLDAARLIQLYLDIDSTPSHASDAMHVIVAHASEAFANALADFDRRFRLAGERGIDFDQHRFQAVFGRNLEYYSGFVFQIEIEADTGWIPVAGGGRYDGLFTAIGSPYPVPAVGSAIHTERLRYALENNRG